MATPTAQWEQVWEADTSCVCCPTGAAPGLWARLSWGSYARLEFILSGDGSMPTLGASESSLHHDEELSLEGKRGHSWPGLEKERRTPETHTSWDPRSKH